MEMTGAKRSAQTIETAEKSHLRASHFARGTPANCKGSGIITSSNRGRKSGRIAWE